MIHSNHIVPRVQARRIDGQSVCCVCPIPLEEGVFGDHSSYKDGTFLYRVVELIHPIDAELVYSGWWFRQTVDVGGVRVWNRISWLSIEKSLTFELPESIDPLKRQGKIEIDFTRGLRIQRFRIWISGELIYDEVS